jgi:quercetin dioxygenase-like cupin family protein
MAFMDRREALMGMFGALMSSTRLPEWAAPKCVDSILHDDPETQVQVLLQKELPDVKEGNSAVSLSVLQVRYAPGARSRAHIHPAYAFVYVVRGEIESQLEGEKGRIYTPGQVFFEAAGRKHLIARNANSTEEAEFIAVFVGKAGAPLTIPLDQSQER